MEAQGAAERAPLVTSRAPTWLLGLIPVVLIALGAAAFAALGAPGLGERTGPPAEDLVVERSELRPGVIELTVRNDGPDAVRVAQIAINDAYVNFSASAEEIGRLGSGRFTIDYPWVDGEAYEVGLLTSTGGVVGHEIEVAVETPSAGLGFYGLMALLGFYVGIIPVSIGMLWLPFVRRIRDEWMRLLLSVTIGLLVFLGIDATLEGVEIGGAGAQAFGGAGLVVIGALASYLALAAIDAAIHSRARRAGAAGASGMYLALLVAIGVGLHNLGEGLAIGSSYAVGALALGAFLVVGFALHNTTEGLAIVAPVGAKGESPSLVRLVGLGVVAGAPVIVGAWIGAAAFNPSIAALLLGVGAGAIARVVQQIAPAIRDGEGRTLHPLSVAGLLGGIAIMYVTGLLVSI